MSVLTCTPTTAACFGQIPDKVFIKAIDSSVGGLSQSMAQDGPTYCSLVCRNKLGAREPEKEKEKAQANMEKNSRKERKKAGWSMFVGRGENGRSRPRTVKDLGRGSMCHEARGR